MKKKIKTLDLFTGIGGFSLGLENVCETMAYCEIDALCRHVLRANMRKGNLKVAPVFDDVTKLSVDCDDLEGMGIEMITAGSPCQDISGANPYAVGIHGPKSKLVFEVMRIADTIPTLKFILLENSPAIVHKGLDIVLNHLRQRGFSYAWGIGSASESGALHTRRRWVCFAYKTDIRESNPTLEFELKRGIREHHIHRPEPARVIPYNLSSKSVCGMLGNSVVPWFISDMLCVLTSAAQSVATESGTMKHKVMTWNSTTLTSTTTYRADMGPKSRVDLQFAQGDQRFQRDSWATPRKSAWWVPKRLHKRTMLYIVAQVMHEKATREYLKGNLVEEQSINKPLIVNPEFVEWLMMYPEGWTSFGL